ncbi:hypothetical protein OEZ86_008703 [Tetradesmus obliquus]|nr:hypothetical protein OEZ86_008703 [Tetradesmus obliquus]
MGIAFSGGGFRYTYFVGVMDVLVHKLRCVAPGTLLSGASCGALIAVFTKCGLPVETVLELTRKFSHECATNGVKGRLGIVLRAYLDAYLPHNAHELCDGNTFLAVTKVWPSIRTRLFSSFPTRPDLISAVMASCHLPSLSDGSFTVNFKGRLHIDGGLLSVVTPPPNAAHTVLVCSMPSKQIARLPAFIGRPRQADISISPDNFQDWPFSRTETTSLALEPPSPAFIDHMVERGRADAWAWAEAVGFARNGMPLLPPATKLEQLRQHVFSSSSSSSSSKLQADLPRVEVQFA